MTMRVDNTLKSWTSGASKPEGFRPLRLSLMFLGVGHMGTPKQISSSRQKDLPFRDLHLAILPKIHHETVKDLGMISWLHNKEFEGDSIFRRAGPY
jgi:hypothetical protein